MALDVCAWRRFTRTRRCSDYIELQVASVSFANKLALKLRDTGSTRRACRRLTCKLTRLRLGKCKFRYCRNRFAAPICNLHRYVVEWPTGTDALKLFDIVETPSGAAVAIAEELERVEPQRLLPHSLVREYPSYVRPCGGSAVHRSTIGGRLFALMHAIVSNHAGNAQAIILEYA